MVTGDNGEHSPLAVSRVEVVPSPERVSVTAPPHQTVACHVPSRTVVVSEPSLKPSLKTVTAEAVQVWYFCIFVLLLDFL